jgi:hypothetical protein
MVGIGYVMLYGTAHDRLNRRRPGLSGLAYPVNYAEWTMVGNNFRYPPGNYDVPLSCGIDQNNNVWIEFNNQYFYKESDLTNFLALWGNSGRASFDSTNQGAMVGYNLLQNSVQFSTTPYGTFSIADVVGKLRAAGVAFTAYAPPPAPAPVVLPPVATGQSSTAHYVSVPSLYTKGTSNWYFLAPASGVELSFPNSAIGGRAPASNSISETPNSGGGYHYRVQDAISGIILEGDTAPAGAAPMTPSAPGGFLQPITVSAPSVNIPPGYSTLTGSLGIPRAFPIYGTPPDHNPANNTWSFNFAKGFTSLLGNPLMGGNPLGLDSQKFSVGIYAYRESDLGAITGDNGRTYELWQLDIYDTAANKAVGTFFETVEGGGGGLWISDPLELASRIIVDVATMGYAEAARAAAQAAGVSEQNIKLATEAGAALAVTVATVGAGAVLTAPGASVAATAFPVAADAASPVALIPVTAEVSAEAAAGSTLLPASLSLIAPVSVSALPAVVGTAAATGTIETVAATTAPAAGGGTSLVSGATAAAEKAVGSVVLATGTTALATEIKKLTGQLPQSTGGYIPGAPAPATPSGTPAKSISPLAILGAIGAAILVAKK